MSRREGAVDDLVFTANERLSVIKFDGALGFDNEIYLAQMHEAEFRQAHYHSYHQRRCYDQTRTDVDEGVHLLYFQFIFLFFTHSIKLCYNVFSSISK